EKSRDELRQDGTLVYEENLVRADLKEGQPAFGIPSTRIAESLGRTIVQNIVMLGFFTAVTGIVPREAMREAVKASVPAGTEELNLQAFDAGVEHFDKTYGEGRSEQEEETVPVGST
ncbi:MAG: pyruvate ferredoxin oxidoreductase, partial [bacterium]|nr:pyruvate ferredoxin oxidoreductase [bacterium]